MEIRVPDLGDFADVEIIEILVSPGDVVAREDGLVTLETDKASMDVPAPEAGVIEALTVTTGDRVSAGDVIAILQPAADENEAAGVTVASNEPPAAADNGEDAAIPVDITMVVPDIGDFADVDVIEVHVAAGDTVGVEDALVTLETDKASMDVPSTAAGIVRSVLVKAGDKVSEGSPLAVIEGLAAAKEPGPKPGAQAPSQAVRASPPQVVTQAPVAPQPLPARLPSIDEAGFSRAHASPSVRKLARELGVNLVQVRGSGQKSRILHDDVKAFVKAILTGQAGVPGSGLPKVPVVDFAKFGDIEITPLTRIQKIAGPRLQASWINLPHVTQHDVADITDLEKRRQGLKGIAKEQGFSLTPLAFVMKACVFALRQFPKVNASLSGDGESLVFKHYYHLGFAADTENGLVVPVIRDVDEKDVFAIARELGELSARAREGSLKADQLQGATFTVSSLGGIGGTAFTPIVNAPEVAILGVSRSSMQPVWNGQEFMPRLMLPLSFSYDHRVIDGADAARFTTFLAEVLADVDGLLGEGLES
jgi:pyruvate dehydrogenase E2 component (dihydrolipoamide acetyltransferase)